MDRTIFLASAVVLIVFQVFFASKILFPCNQGETKKLSLEVQPLPAHDATASLRVESKSKIATPMGITKMKRSVGVPEMQYSPYYRPAPLPLPLSKENRKVGPIDPGQLYWKKSPSLYWSNPEEPLMSNEDLPRCQSRVNYKGDPNWVKTLNGGFNRLTWDNSNLLGLNPRCYEFWRYMPTLPQYMNLFSGATTNFGQDVYSSGVMFAGQDRLFLEFVMLRKPEAKRFVEFGTAAGITSVFLGISAAMREGELHTFDIKDFRCQQAKAVWNDKYMIRHYEDILEAAGECRPFSCTPTNQPTITEVSRADIFLVDNGVKDKEVFLYAKYAPVGSIVMVHDMTFDQRQFDLFDMPFRYHGYEAVYRDFAESIGTHLRAWVRKSGNVSSALRALLKEPNQRFPAHTGLV